MRFRTRMDLWGAALLSSLSAMQAGCGGATTGAPDQTGEGGHTGGVNTGGVNTGGASTGGASTGGAGASAGAGNTGAGGRAQPSGGAPSAGAGGSTGARAGTGGASAGAGGWPGGTGGTHEGTGGGSGGFTLTGGSSNLNPFACKNPKPLVAATATGYEQCSDGHIHRVSKAECPSNLPRSVTHPANAGDLCATDADCTAKAHGYCSAGPSLGQIPSYSCAYGCRVDSECAAGDICLCGPTIGTCVHAKCTSDEDCGKGIVIDDAIAYVPLECASYEARPSDSLCTTPPPAFACQTRADTCGGPADCVKPPTGWADCDLVGESRSCSSVASCAVAGRPFLVDGNERLASLAERSDWLDDNLAPSVVGLDRDLRDTLAERWARLGCMEHASIAAFARFALQLVSLGAPAELVEQAALALADETRHARACFAVASGYAGRSIGPGPLAIEGSLDATSLEEILVLTVREGCIGETLAAIETLEASEHARDPVVRGLLQRISADETRHAQLAWRFVAWALAKLGPEAPERARVAAELERGQRPLVAARESTLDAESQRLLSHGIVNERLSGALRSAVCAEIIRPCAVGLGLLRNRSELTSRAALSRC